MAYFYFKYMALYHGLIISGHKAGTARDAIPSQIEFVRAIDERVTQDPVGLTKEGFLDADAGPPPSLQPPSSTLLPAPLPSVTPFLSASPDSGWGGWRRAH